MVHDTYHNKKKMDSHNIHQLAYYNEVSKIGALISKINAGGVQDGDGIPDEGEEGDGDSHGPCTIAPPALLCAHPSAAQADGAEVARARGKAPSKPPHSTREVVTHVLMTKGCVSRAERLSPQHQRCKSDMNSREVGYVLRLYAGFPFSLSLLI